MSDGGPELHSGASDDFRVGRLQYDDMSESMAGSTAKGIHHITAVSGDPQENINFYQSVLGQRLIKTTVNFDDPSTWHFYYGDAVGSPGTILTFFPWRNVRPGRVGTGESIVVSYAIPAGSAAYWKKRLDAFGFPVEDAHEFGEYRIQLRDPHGMRIDLVETSDAIPAYHWAEGPVPAEYALAGFHSTTLLLDDVEPTLTILRELLGYSNTTTDGNTVRVRSSSDWAGSIDLVGAAGSGRGAFGSGSIHHIAFRADNDEAQRKLSSTAAQMGLGVTEVKDRQYFRSVYFREPGGVLFEIATDGPGFLTDEDRLYLGQSLKLPPWLEPRRKDIADRLPAIDRSVPKTPPSGGADETASQ